MHTLLEKPRLSAASNETVQKRDRVEAALLTLDANVDRTSFAALPERQRFDAMFATFEEAGGIANGDEVEGLLEERQTGNYVWLAKAMAGGEILSIAWSSTHWIPLFQFDRRDLSVHREVSCVLAELRDVYDNWEIGCWFTEPNSWLDARRPLDLLFIVPGRVSQAARADRFIATS